METITRLLFWVANSLLIPNIIILLILFVRSLILIGSFYNSYMVKRKTDGNLRQIKDITPDTVSDLRNILPRDNHTLFTRYLADFLSRPVDDDYVNFQLNNFENEAEKDISLSKLLAKIGPVLGLIGTLISMSPALVGLSAGDIGGMAYNMQIVFATTVVGLVISLIGLVTLQYKQRWYAKDLNNLEYITAQLIQKEQNHEPKSETEE
ncbi:MotA/TolQ/ExbB proton channel family protein [Porphyromonas pogonae]|uniref:MotA/TolQ/ExbB proton channel family protein n=1 Tax=Porphyromonas pogonae TaxID=867595 RepID=UPI002E75ADDA|nr:MotA/TolQ/ExbB proton channel family protein [Porphyromonas pogonae]